MKLNWQWDRVRATPPTKDNQLRRKRNKATLKNKLFLTICKNLNIKPTTRQASKWNNKKGLAYRTQFLIA